MTDFNYREYSLSQLENWMHDAMSAGEASPQEIYDTIHKVVSENYYTYKEQTAKAYELLSLLNGNGKGHIKAYDDCVDKVLSCNKDDPSPECKGAWDEFWGQVDKTYDQMIEEGYEMTDDGFWVPQEDKVVKWQLTVQVDGLTGDCFVNLPDDLLERAGLLEGDVVEWIDRGDGSFEIRKVNGAK